MPPDTVADRVIVPLVVSIVGLAVSVRANGVTTMGAGLTVMVKLVLAERLPGSVAVTVMPTTPDAEGVPEMMRVVGSNENPLAGLMLA